MPTAFSEPELRTYFRVIARPGTGPKIRVAKTALAQLDSQTRGGLEVGGIVMGEPLDWNAPDVVITGFFEVSINYSAGSTFRPGESDFDLFREVAAEIPGSAIGYYRSQLGEEFAIRPEDKAAVAALFPQTHACMIGVSAGLRAGSRASLYEVRAGAGPVLLTGFPLLDDPQNKTLPPKAALRRPPLVVSPMVRRISMGAAGVAAIAALAYNLGRHSSATPPSTPAEKQPATQSTMRRDSRIDLKIVEHGPQLEIRWNAADPAIATAVRGMLIVTDAPGIGDVMAGLPGSGDIELDAAQMRKGSYLYKPVSNNFSVLLMIYQPDGSFTGDIKEYNGGNPEVPSPLSALPPAKPLEPPPVAARAPKPTRDPVPARVTRSFTTHQTPPTRKAARIPAVLEPPPTAVAAAVASGPKLPAMAMLLPPPVATPPVLTPTAPGPAATSPSSPALTTPAAAAASAAAPQSRTALNSRPAVPSNRYLAPRVLHQAVPAVPLGVAPRIRSEVELEVSVTLDVDGKVTGAHIIASQGAAAGLLAIEALKAAQLSRFLPAQLDGRPVSGSAVLTFRFAPRPN